MKNLTEGKPINLILSLAIPMLIGNIFQQIYNVVDTVVVGRYLGEEALAGVGSTGTLTGVLLAFVYGLGTGAGLIIAQAFGKQAKKELNDTIVALTITSFLFSLVVTGIGFFAVKPLLVFLKVPDESIEYALPYLRIMFIFCFASVAYNASSGILRSLGDSKTPLFALIISSFTNIFLDILFTLYLGFGVRGVAFATIIAQVLSCIFNIVNLYRRRNIFGIEDLKPIFNQKYVKKIIKTGFPSAFQSCMISLGGLSVQRLINSFGSSVMAAYVAANKVDSIAIQIVVAISTSLSIYTGQNIGKGNLKRVKEGLYQTLLIMLMACIILAILIPCFRYELMGIFLDEETSTKAISIGATYLSIIGIAYIIAGVMNTYLNVIKGAGDVNTCMVAGLTELFGRILFAYLLSNYLGFLGIWLATPISWGCGCIIPVVRYYSGKWKTKTLV